MRIIGAGMAGLLAGHVFRRFAPIIMEAQKALPNNHEALLRFRSDGVGQATGVAFTKATVRKAIVFRDSIFTEANPYMANMYSRKVIGEVRSRSIWNLETSERWIAPQDFTKQMSNPLSIYYNAQIETKHELLKLTGAGPVISTMPMPILMEIVGWPDRPRFGSLPIWSIQVQITEPLVDVYQTHYYPDPELPYYRASLTGNRLIVEYGRAPTNVDDDLQKIASDFGIEPVMFLQRPEPREHRLGKIAPIEDGARKDFIYTMTREYGIYSLGRFAIWKQVLLDDVLSDCKVIESLVSAEGRRCAYQQKLATVRKGTH